MQYLKLFNICSAAILIKNQFCIFILGFNINQENKLIAIELYIFLQLDILSLIDSSNVMN